MKKFSLTATLVVCTLTGCGSATSISVPKAPHGGALFSALDGNKVVEVVIQKESAGKGKTQFVTYFLDDQMKPLTPQPTAATFQPRSPRGAPVVELKPTETAGASGMSCPPIEDAGELSGQLTATIDGKPIVFTINVR